MAHLVDTEPNYVCEVGDKDCDYEYDPMYHTIDVLIILIIGFIFWIKTKKEKHK